MRRMVCNRNVLGLGLGGAHFAREHDIAEQYLAIVAIGEAGQHIGLDHRKGQDIGRLVFAAIGGVQRLHLAIVGQLYRYFDRCGFVDEIAMGRLERGFGNGLERQHVPIRPILPCLAALYGDCDHPAPS